MLSSIYCLPEYFEIYACNDTKASNDNAKIKLVSNFRYDIYYIIIYKNVINNFVTGLIPIFSLAWFNYKIYKCFIKRRDDFAEGRYMSNYLDVFDPFIRKSENQIEIVLHPYDLNQMFGKHY